MSSKTRRKARKSGSAADTPDQATMAAAIDTFKEWAAKNPGAATAAIEALKEVAQVAPAVTYSGPKRAICLGGGGPAAGLHIGALEGLKARGIDFGNARSIWALSCIGAWVGVIYNQAEKNSEIETTYNFFHDVFRNDPSFQSFPTNTIFAPDWAGCAEAAWDFLLEPRNYRNAFLPREIMKSFLYTMSAIRRMGAVRRRKHGDVVYEEYEEFSEADFNRWTLNHVLAVHPAVRLLTALVYKSDIDGRSRLFYKDSKFLNDIKFEQLNKPGKPYIFHNAFNFAKHNIDIFANDSPSWARQGYKTISAASLCACSALPFVEQTVRVDGHPYCEGALVDTVNFRNLLKDHHHEDDPLEEIWINRIVDVHQIRKPKNIHDALANLCQMFAATVGEDDIKLFKFHVQENNRLPEKEREAPKWTGTMVEIQVDDQVDFHWSHENLNRGRSNGARAAENAHTLYKMYNDKYQEKNKREGKATIIPDDLTDEEIMRAGVPLPLKRQRRRQGG
jgi:predicted acylesterase/phospholipase RssA